MGVTGGARAAISGYDATGCAGPEGSRGRTRGGRSRQFRDPPTKLARTISSAAALLLDVRPAVEPPLDLLLEAAVPRLVVGAALERARQARHVGDRVVFVVRVLIALAVREIFHQLRRRVAQVQRHRL